MAAFGQESEEIEGEIVSERPGSGELVVPEMAPMPLTAAQQEARVQFDVAVATAHQYPRSPEVFRRKLKTLATMSQAIAASCFYTLPGRKGGSGKPISGPSIRMAEIVAAAWGNLQYGAQLVEVNRIEGFIIMRGMCHDLESNTKVVKDTMRSIRLSSGGIFGDNMIQVTAQAAASIAIRNAILGCVPQAYVNEIYLAVQKVGLGMSGKENKPLAEIQQACLDNFSNNFGITAEQIYKSVGVNGKTELDVEKLSLLRGYYTSIETGECEAKDIFPAVEKAADIAKKLKEKAAGKGDEKKD